MLCLIRSEMFLFTFLSEILLNCHWSGSCFYSVAFFLGMQSWRDFVYLYIESDLQ